MDARTQYPCKPYAQSFGTENGVRLVVSFMQSFYNCKLPFDTTKAIKNVYWFMRNAIHDYLFLERTLVVSETKSQPHRGRN